MATIGLVNVTPLEIQHRKRRRTAKQARGIGSDAIFAGAAGHNGIGACEYRANDVARIELEWQDEPLPGAANVYGVDAAAMKLRFRDAEHELRGTIKYFSDSFGPAHPSVGEAWSEYGSVLRSAGLFEQARAAYEQALAIFVHEHGEVHRANALVKSYLGLTFLYAGDHDSALELLLASQDIQTTLKAQSSNDYAENLNTLGVIRVRQGEPQLAVADFRRALELWQKNQAPVHPDIALAMSNLGTSYALMGALDMAESYYRAALDMRRILFCNTGHVALAIGLNNLAMLLRRRGELVKAEPLMRESLAVRCDVCGSVSPTTITGLHNMATILRDNGNLLGAEAVQRDAIVACSVLREGEHPDVALTRANLAETLVAQGRHDEALREASAALMMLKRTVGANHWRVMAANGIKGVALARQGEFATAEPLILGAYEGIRAARGDQDVFTRRALDRVVQFYADCGQSGRLREYQERRQQLYPNP
ncbi:MAG: tetratricopeptide repeat protein [Gammaproteobacteria bacterium]|nr:tetratricopeptide repeat protein [Gammaproteobacteria bacterium]